MIQVHQYGRPLRTMWIRQKNCSRTDKPSAGNMCERYVQSSRQHHKGAGTAQAAARQTRSGERATATGALPRRASVAVAGDADVAPFQLGVEQFRQMHAL